MIALKKIRLVNWYGFSQVTAPIGRFTLIAGKNGNGKSVLLDAIKYALYGDTVFNKSSENKGSRTVSSYTRGLLDATSRTYMREPDKVPNVYTHIVLEMEEAELGRQFLLGTVIETDAGNGFRTQRYVIENRTLDEVSHTYEKDGSVFSYSSAELQEKYGLRMLDVREGLAKFMQRTGLRLNGEQLRTFRRKLRSVMSYDPNAKIDRFIRESVLEEKTVDFSKLVTAKNYIDGLQNSFEKIDAELRELDEILTLFDALTRMKNNLLADDVKIVYRKSLALQKTLEDTWRNIKIASKQIEKDEEILQSLEKQKEQLRKACFEAKNNRDSMDCAKAIADAENVLQAAQAEKKILEKKKDALCTFQRKISELIAWFAEENCVVPQQNLLAELTGDRISGAEKEGAVASFYEEIKKYRDKIHSEKTRIDDLSKENAAEQAKCQQMIEDCNAKKATFSQIPEYVGLKKEINREFQKRGIPGEARFACEYVLKLKDEKWRDAIEGYLGARRYTILVEPQYYDIADDVLNHSKYKYAHLFNTKLLMKKEITPQENAVVHFIDVKNPVAKKYFDWQLGRLRAAEINEVRKYENALSKEGRVSVAMDSTFVRFERIRFYCMGQEALELNRLKAVKRLERLKEEAGILWEQRRNAKEKIKYLDEEMGFFVPYDYDACKLYEKAGRYCMDKERELLALQEAQKNNTEYMEIVRRIAELEQEQAAAETRWSNVYQDKLKQEGVCLSNSSQRETAGDELESIREQLAELQILNNVVYTRAIEEYDKFVANGEEGRGGILKDRKRADRELQDIRINLGKAQSAYNVAEKGRNPLPQREDAAAIYQERKTHIWMDDLQQIKANLEEQTKRYEEIFKNEFVLTVLESCEAAKDDLKLINAELASLEFKVKYAFDVKYVEDSSDYENILEYARYLKERERLGGALEQMTVGAVTTYSDEDGRELEKRIKEIINRIVQNNDQERIAQYADYRNYMAYDVLLESDGLKKSRLSEQSGYSSGAEVQIPYLLILLSALLIIYNDKSNATRLVFIDEPFTKMDPSNVKIMLDFMKKQDLQMIFCAPDKTELIGNECEVILPVLRTRKDRMEIGIVKMHEKNV